ncbi:hypothetical protein D3C77_310200 [compost metagenome]
MPKASVLLLTCAFAIDSASAQGSIEEAKGAKILAAGKIEEYACPGLGMYDCSGWPENLYRFVDQDICFTSKESCSLDCDAVLIDKEGQQSVLLVGGRYADNISPTSGQAEKCPADFTQ